jgi:hypothetical protein
MTYNLMRQPTVMTTTLPAQLETHTHLRIVQVHYLPVEAHPSPTDPDHTLCSMPLAMLTELEPTTLNLKFVQLRHLDIDWDDPASYLLDLAHNPIGPFLLILAHTDVIDDPDLVYSHPATLFILTRNIEATLSKTIGQLAQPKPPTQQHAPTTQTRH